LYDNDEDSLTTKNRSNLPKIGNQGNLRHNVDSRNNNNVGRSKDKIVIESSLDVLYIILLLI
jgi:hypothetical protein